MRQYKLVLSYDGANYVGWQMQPNGVSIQSLVQNALRVLTKEDVKVIGSGRTDAGVHAFSQTTAFRTESELDPRSTLRSLNGILPYDIRALTLEEVPLDFHPIHSAKGKIYQYHFCQGQIQSPFKRGRSWLIREALDMELLKKAKDLFVGTHDFSSFANKANEGSAAKNPVRTIYRIDLVEEGDGFYLEFEGNGFLYKMVRNLVGMIIAVAKAKRPIEDIPKVLAAKDRRQASGAAPPHGLYLVKTHY